MPLCALDAPGLIHLFGDQHNQSLPDKEWKHLWDSVKINEKQTFKSDLSSEAKQKTFGKKK